MAKAKIRIIWNGSGGELDSVVVEQKNEASVSDALVELVEGNIVNAGDSIVIEEIPS